MKYIKTFENIEQIIDLKNKNIQFLCIKETDPHFYWKFTKGKKYKLYVSELRNRLKDDKNKFFNITYIIDETKLIDSINNNDIYTFKYADGIFTTAKSIEDYVVDIEMKKYNL